MLKITIPRIEQYDEIKEEFITSKEHVLQLEHSLVSLSKWELKWKKPFIASGEKTVEETIDYIRCMTITQNVPEEAYAHVTNENVNRVKEYIADDMTATTFSKEHGTISREIITAEILYYYMITLNIPFECQKWHLNRLMALIKVCSIKNSPPKKMNKHELAKRNRDLNAERKKALKTEG